MDDFGVIARADRHRGETPAYSTSGLIAALRLVADDGYVSSAMYKHAYTRAMGSASPLPSTKVFSMRFGSWKKACQVAGLRHGRQTRPSYPRLSDDELVAAVVLAADTMGDLPSLGEYRGFRSLHPELRLPCDALIRARLGGWASALKQAAARRFTLLEAHNTRLRDA